MTPRIALLGFSIECNRFAPVATEADFSTRTLLSGQAMLDEARSSAPRMLGELPGFLAAMDAAGPGSRCQSCSPWPSPTARSIRRSSTG